MLPSLADLEHSNFLPSALEPTVQQLLQDPYPSLTIIALRSLYFYLQEQLDQFLLEDSPDSSAAPGDGDDGDDGDLESTAQPDTRDGDDGDLKSTAQPDTRDGDDGDPSARGPRDADGFYNYYPAGFDPGPDLVIDDALLYRVYHRRFYFTASDLLVHFRGDCLIFGRDDIRARLTPSSIAHELKRLALPFHRTGPRRLYSLNFPFLIWLLQLYQACQLFNALHFATTPARHPLDPPVI